MENMYVQLGQRFALRSNMLQQGMTQEELVAEFFSKINFRNYIPIQRGIIERISMSILVRESSHHLPSDNAILGLLKAHLQKEIMLKEYKQMGAPLNELANYYDIRHIVHKKWEQ